MMTHSFQVRTLLFLLLTLAVMGCYRQTFVDKTQLIEQQPNVERWQKNLLFGLVAGPDIHMGEACPSGIAKVEEYFSFTNGVVTVITLGLFSPYTIELYCAQECTSRTGPRTSLCAR